MQITTALRDALAGRHHLLTAALEQAGHLPAGRGLSLDDRTLETSDADAPNYGADLLSDDEMMAQAAQAVQNIRQYRGLAGTPTESQRKAYEDLLGRIAIHYIRSRFPQLGG
jgi:hypothetical protein